MTRITIAADRLRSFGESRESTFYLVCGPELVDRFRVDPGARYAGARVIGYDGRAPFAELLRREIPENAHILVILPGTYFRSPDPADLGPTRKLGVLACFSTPSSLESIAHFIGVAERTDPGEQEQLADRFFARGESTECLQFVDREHGTSARFEHLADDLSWNEQLGRLDWGAQQLFPSGEISVLPVEVFGQNIEERFRIDGRLALKGEPVLHAGTPSYLPEDQERLYRSLATMREAAVVVELRDGLITAIEASDPACAPAARTLDRMGQVDSRYRSLLELGFGINTALEFFPSNSAMNEVYGGTAGVVHFGLGLIPYTQYHLDIVCPGTEVIGADGEHVFGGPGRP